MMLIVLLAWLAPTDIPATPPTPPAPPITDDEYFSEVPKAGLTPELFDRPEKARGNVVALFSTDDYPLQSIRNAEEGIVAVVLRIGRDGRVADCVVDRSSGHAALDAQTCRILWQRARFVPAKDKDGNAVESAWRQRIRWELPEADPMPLKPWTMRLTLEFVEEGGVTSCEVETSGALPNFQREEEGCRFFMQLSGPLARFRADAGYKRRKTVLETSFAPGVEIPTSNPPSGMQLFAHQVARLSVDETGKTLACRVIEAEGRAKQREGCDDLLHARFEPPGIEVGAIEVTVARNLYLSE